MKVNDMCAYDYETQRWVTGKAAADMILAQTEEQLNMLTSDRGEDFARLIGGVNRQDAIRSCRETIEDLAFFTTNGGF